MRRILATRTYAGDMEQGRVRKLNYKSTKTVRLPPQDWIVVPGTQEAIIDRADFDAVQRMLAAAPVRVDRHTCWQGLSTAASAAGKWS